jgi:hydrogenase maturation protease
MNVVGLGNDWRSDDGVGLEVARRLGGTGLTGEPVGLVEALNGSPEIVLVDAVRSGAAPGTVHVFDASTEPLPAAVFGATSTHTIGLAEAVELARSLGRLPERVLVYGIEGSEFGFGRRLSPEVAAAADRVVEDVRACTSGT